MLRVFNGLYNDRKPISWALDYIKSEGIGTAHPFKDIFPAKLMTLYQEGNWNFIDSVLSIAEVTPNIFRKQYWELGSGPYFEDNYDVFDIPEEFQNRNEQPYGSEFEEG